MKKIETAVEPTLGTIEDYNGQESREKKMTVWIVILTGFDRCGLWDHQFKQFCK